MKTETCEVSVTCELTIRGTFQNVKQLEEAVIEEVRRGACRFYGGVCKAYQSQWLEHHSDRYQGVCWRKIKQVTPFGLVEIPNRVIRDREMETGGYHSLAKMLWRGKATRLLSPSVEKKAIEASVGQNYRPAARGLSDWCAASISHWSLWKCVQIYGKKLLEHQQRDWYVDKPLGRSASVVITELDSTYVKHQRHGKHKNRPRHFPMHVGLHYTGRTRRSPRRGRRDVELTGKTFFVSAEEIGIFGRRLSKQRQRHYSGKPLSVMLSDGDEGIKRVREREFDESIWLLDRWHIAQKVRTFVANDQEAYRKVMEGVYSCESEKVLEALRATSPELQKQKPREFHDLFGYILSNREGIDAFKQIPKTLRQSKGRQEAAVRAGSGAVEKNVEVHINRRFKRQGRSWNPVRADRLAQLKWLQHNPKNWTHWWNQVCLSTTKINPGWPSADN